MAVSKNLPWKKKSSLKKFQILLIFKTENFFRGNWTNEEDLAILSFVRLNGTKWSKLARTMIKRNEHDVKNRFFGILSNYTSTPIKTIKKSMNYLDQEFLHRIEMFFSGEIRKPQNYGLLAAKLV